MKLFAALALIAGVFAVAPAHAETVKLKSIIINENGADEYIADVKNACGLKEITIAVEGPGARHVLAYSEVKVSYETGSPWGVVRDNFRTFGQILSGGSKTFTLRDNAPCVRRVYVEGSADIWPSGQMRLVVYGTR